MSGASPTRCLTSPATLTPSATHNFLYKTSKTAPKGAVFLIFSAIVITVFCCNNDVLLEKLYSFDGETLSLYSSDGKESTLSASLAGDRLIVTVPYSDKSMDIIYSRVK